MDLFVLNAQQIILKIQPHLLNHASPVHLFIIHTIIFVLHAQQNANIVIIQDFLSIVLLVKLDGHHITIFKLALIVKKLLFFVFYVRK